MYSKGNLIYGYPLTDSEHIKQIDVYLENEVPGFLMWYDGGASRQPDAFGIHISTFDCIDPIRLFDLNQRRLDQDYNREIIALLDNLTEEQRKVVLSKGEAPDFYIMWSTS